MKRGFLLSSYQLHGSLRSNCFAQKIDCLLAATKISKASMNVNMWKKTNFLENGISFCTARHVHWCFCRSVRNSRCRFHAHDFAEVMV